MITGNWYSIDGNQVGETLNFNTTDLEFAKIQAEVVTGLSVITSSSKFVVLGDDKRRLVIRR